MMVKTRREDAHDCARQQRRSAVQAHADVRKMDTNAAPACPRRIALPRDTKKRSVRVGHCSGFSSRAKIVCTLSCCPVTRIFSECYSQLSSRCIAQSWNRLRHLISPHLLCRAIVAMALYLRNAATMRSTSSTVASRMPLSSLHPCPTGRDWCHNAIVRQADKLAGTLHGSCCLMSAMCQSQLHAPRHVHFESSFRDCP